MEGELLSGRQEARRLRQAALFAQGHNAARSAVPRLGGAGQRRGALRGGVPDLLHVMHCLCTGSGLQPAWKGRVDGGWKDEGGMRLHASGVWAHASPVRALPCMPCPAAASALLIETHPPTSTPINCMAHQPRPTRGPALAGVATKLDPFVTLGVSAAHDAGIEDKLRPGSQGNGRPARRQRRQPGAQPLS